MSEALEDRLITIDFYEGKPETVKAAYYTQDNGWIQFKDRSHKMVLSIPESRVSAIRSGR